MPLNLQSVCSNCRNCNSEPKSISKTSTGSVSNLRFEYSTVLGNAGVSPALLAQRENWLRKRMQQIGHRAGGDARVPKNRWILFPSFKLNHYQQNSQPAPTFIYRCLRSTRSSFRSW